MKDQATIADVNVTELANALRALAMDAVEAAKSGHPGMPMGMAEIAVALWNRHLRHDPAQPRGPTATASSSPTATVDAAVCAVAPDGVRPADRRAEAVPAAALEDARAPGSRRDARRRDDDRAARPGHFQRGRHGARGAIARGGIQPARPHHRRPPDLCVPGRRLPDGRHFARGLLARGDVGPREARSRSTTTTASPSTARSTAGSPTTRRGASRPTAGT